MQIQKGVCPFGCTEASEDKESDFDDHGHCRHRVGALNLAPGARAEGRLFEPLEPIYYPVRDEDGKPIFDTAEIEEDFEQTVKGKKVKGKRMKKARVPRQIHSGLMRLNGRNRKAVLPTDVILRPEKVQEMLTTIDPLTKLPVAPRLGFCTWVYREDAKTDVVTKPLEDNPAERSRMSMEDKYAEYMEAKAKHAELCKAGKASGVEMGFGDSEDEQEVAEEAARPENQKAEMDELRGLAVAGK